MPSRSTAAQMQIYMELTGLTRAIYVAVCKDTDDLHIERIRADGDAAERLLAKAGRVIDARPTTDAHLRGSGLVGVPVLRPPRGLPRRTTPPPITCRSCLHATPVEGGWHCARWDRHAATMTDQRHACAEHLFIPDLVPGEVVDAGDDYVVYRMRTAPPG